MKLLITDLKTERQWRSATGLDQKRFDKLLMLFEKAYLDLFDQSIEQRQGDCPQQPCLSTYTDLLFFTLFSLKSAGPPVRAYLRFTGLGDWYGWFISQA